MCSVSSRGLRATLVGQCNSTSAAWKQLIIRTECSVHSRLHSAHQKRCAAAQREGVAGGVVRLPAYQGGDLARLVYHPHSLPVTDVNPPVHTHGQTLREGELGCCGRAAVPTVIWPAGNTALSGSRHHLVVGAGGVNSL